MLVSAGHRSVPRAGACLRPADGARTSSPSWPCNGDESSINLAPGAWCRPHGVGHPRFGVALSGCAQAIRAVRDLAVALVGAEAGGGLEEFTTVAHSARCTPYR
jgi:hypothetical protein